MERVDSENENDKKLIAEFVEEYLKSDGVFILRLVGHNADAVTVTEFTVSLWDQYRVRNLSNLGRAEGGTNG